MKTLKTLLTTGVVVASAVVASAQPFTQNVDTNASNIGIRATFNPTTRPIVGDDWSWQSGGQATEIAIWGSWLNDVVDPNVTFKLSIHRDNPPGAGSVPWSRPGQEIWNYVGGAAQTTLAASGLTGSFFDFTTGTSGSSSDIYKFTFQNFANPFNVTPGTIYWLVVQAQTTGGAQFAWNSSWQHATDAAVFGNNASFGSTRVVFNPMTYGQAGMDPSLGNIDLAFTIAPEPSSFAVLGLGLAALFMRRKLA
jgi:hypothetical protein